MKKLLVVVALLSFVLATAAIVLAAQSNWRGQQWDYMHLLYLQYGNGNIAIASSDSDLEQQMNCSTDSCPNPRNIAFYLNIAGQEGWELVAVTRSASADLSVFEMILKRPVP